MKYLAEKVFSMSPNIHKNPSFKIDNLKVISSYKIRCQQSASVFTDQFIDVINKENKDADLSLIDKDDLHLEVSETLRIFDHCDRYNLLVRMNKSAFIENEIFQKSQYFDVLKKYLFRVLHVDLSSSEIISLFKLCAFKYALIDDLSVCDLFEEDHLEILGYDGDMKHFYKTGFGHPINSQMFCSFLSEIIERFDKIVSKKHLYSKYHL